MILVTTLPIRLKERGRGSDKEAEASPASKPRKPTAGHKETEVNFGKGFCSSVTAAGGRAELLDRSAGVLVR